MRVGWIHVVMPGRASAMMKGWLFVGLPVLVCLCHYFQQSSALQRRDHDTVNLQSTGKTIDNRALRSIIYGKLKLYRTAS